MSDVEFILIEIFTLCSISVWTYRKNTHQNRQPVGQSFNMILFFFLKQVELSFSTGNVLHVFGDMDDDGFFMAELNGQRGLVPSNFLTEAPPDYRNPSGGSGPGARGPPPPPRHQDRRKGPYSCNPHYFPKTNFSLKIQIELNHTYHTLKFHILNSWYITN